MAAFATENDSLDAVRWFKESEKPRSNVEGSNEEFRHIIFQIGPPCVV